MGISDDIVPKKSSRHLSNPYHRHAEEADAPEHASDPEDREEGTQPAAFFSERNENDPDIDQPQEKKKAPAVVRFFRSWLLWLFIFILIGLLTYRNLALIKDTFNKYKNGTTAETSTNTSTATDTATHVEEIKPQDYTTPATDTTTPAATTPATTPAATTTTTISAAAKAAIKIQVLNGNGVTGSANTVKTTLVAAGFKVSSMGNASNFAYTQTTIFYKTGKSAEAELAKAALTTRTVVTTNSDSKAGSYDLVIVVGKN